MHRQQDPKKTRNKKIIESRRLNETETMSETVKIEN